MNAQAEIDVAAAAATDESRAQRAAKRKRLLLLLLVVVATGGLLYGLWSIFVGGRSVSTDNAYVGADIAQVTPRIDGTVAQVLVSDTDPVERGQTLVVLDDDDARVAVAEAEAELDRASRRVAQTGSQGEALAAQITARAAEIRRARAQAAQASSDLERARIELQRRQALAASGAVSGEELTTARNALAQARANVASAEAGIAQAQSARIAASGDYAANQALLRGVGRAGNPEVLAARAKLDRARLNLARTVVRAPVDGVVARRQVQIGQRVQAGAPLMTIVPLGQVYVDANFKEVQLARVKPGQPVELTSDLYGDDVVYHGRVLGFSGGTGAAFALIPAQNATGNWIKVVQRLPVRIRLDPRELAAHPLRVGLSMEATITLGEDR